MIEITEVLRRRQAGQGLREISRETGVDRKTVRRYVQAADEVGAEPTEEVVGEVIHQVQTRPPPPRSKPRQRLQEHRALIVNYIYPSTTITRSSSKAGAVDFPNMAAGRSRSADPSTSPECDALSWFIHDNPGASR